ncbi:MAG: PriCT-2 domain-containing protein [Pseudohongiella sp.]|nr:PriCT-2 domain-containing protein [Pseudohongiella sp.]
MNPDYEEAKSFLSLLDEKATSFTFQTFDDNIDHKNPSLTRLIHGTLEACWTELVELNQKGAGVFISVNETDGKGRRKENIVRIRCLWVDDDGDGEKPNFSHITVETSPGKHHYYVLIENMELDMFEHYQQEMVNRFGSDPNAKDRSRVLRLPGFLHQKRSTTNTQARGPHLVKITEVPTFPTIDGAVIKVFIPDSRQTNATPKEKEKEKEKAITWISPAEIAPTLIPNLEDAISFLDLSARDTWIETGCALKDLGDAGFLIWHARSADCENYEGEVDCRMVWRTLSSDRTNYKAIFAKAQRAGWTNPYSSLAHANNVFCDNPIPIKQDKITIKISDRHLYENVSLAAQSLSNMAPHLVYQRGLNLVEVVRMNGSAQVGELHDVASIRPLKLAGMRVKLSESANWIKGNPPKKSTPCNDVTSGLLESPNKWRGIPVLNGISDVPILKKNGEIITKEGYEYESKLYIKGPLPKLSIPPNPSREDAISAANRLLGVFSEFPFAYPEVDRSVLLSYMITLAIRHEISTAPMIGIDSSTPGSGKDLLTNCANLIVLGIRPSIMPPVKGLGAEEETRKRITAMLSQGVSSVVLDNWTTPVGGDSLNVLLTSDSWTDRILGKSEAVRLPSRVTWTATGNNLVFRGDMTRRALILRLDPRVEKPELREFRVTNLIAHVMAHRAELLSALFTILKAFQLANFPQPAGPSLGSFEEWHKRVVGCLLWIDFKNPVDSQLRIRDVDPEQAEHEELITLLYKIYQSRPFRVADLTKTTSAPSEDQIKLQTLLRDMAPAGTSDIDRKRLGHRFSRYADRISAGYTLKKVERSGKTNASLSYFVQEVA